MSTSTLTYGLTDHEAAPRSDRWFALAMAAIAGLLALGVLASWWNGPVERPGREVGALPVAVLGADGITPWSAGVPTVLHVWLPGCGTCAAEVPTYEAARAAYGADVRFVAVSILDDPKTTRQTADRWGIGGERAMTTGNLMAALDLGEVPATAWIDADGRLVALARGPVEDRVFLRETARLAASGGD